MTMMEEQTLVQDLSQLEVFEACTPEALEPVVRALTGMRTVAEGEVVCTEGDLANEWWIVAEGIADVTTNGQFVASIGPGETIGELALLDNQPRNATVTARTTMVLHVVGGSGFIDALLTSPSLGLGMLRQLAVRLRGVTRTLAPAPAAPAAVTAVTATAVRPITELQVAFNPSEPGYFDNPYAQYAALRATDPVHLADSTGSYVITRYDDVHRLNRDRSMVVSIDYATSTASIDAERERLNANNGIGRLSMLRRDGEDHTRLRRLVTKVFTPRAIGQWRERAETLVDSLLADAAQKNQIDVITDYALKLPAQIISEMLGMPHEDIGKLRAWSNAIAKTLDPLNTPEEAAASIAASGAMTAYLIDVIEDKRRNPASDILTDLIRAEESGEKLTFDELRIQILLLYIAGHETTLNLIGNGLTNLFRFPSELDRLRTDPSLDANTIEELLRFDSPVQFTRRITAEPVEAGGKTIPAGTVVTLGLASGNRDPEKWGPTADQIDLSRKGANEHLSFGAGAHYCLGATLARLEAQIALPRLVRAFPRMTPAYQTPAWSKRIVLRGVENLMVNVHG